jgi:hypothetical protein
MKRKIIAIFIIIAPLLIGTFYQIFISVISSSLPFRESYEPTILGILLTYLIPLLIGVFSFSMIDKSKVQTSFYYINLTLATTFLIAIPFLLKAIATPAYWYDFDASIYFLILFMFLFLLGGSLTGLKASPPGDQKNLLNKDYSITKLDVLVCTSIATIVLAFNLFPLKNSHYLIGADIYYHSAMSQQIYDGGGIKSNPLFKNSSNHYLSIGYYIIAYFSKITHLSLNTIWLIYTPILSFGFMIFFYLFLKRILGNWRVATLGTLLVVPYREILWPDVSLKGLSFFFFSIFLFNFASYLVRKKTSYLLISTIFFVLAGATHPEIALHETGILIAYLLLLKTPLLKTTLKWFQRPTKTKANPGYYLSSLDSSASFSFLLFLVALLLTQQMIYAVHAFPGGKTCIFNEIPLSYCQPIGAISVLPFLFGIITLALYLDYRQKENVFLLSIASLFLITIFYFLHLWQFYHRYFAETAYFGIVGLACISFYDLPYKNKVFLAAISLLLLISVYPKASFMNEYSLGINNTLSLEQPTFNLIKEETKPKSVILLRPSEILNRHIPFYTDRYIVAGNDKITKEVQWQVLSTCNGPFAKDCDARLALSENFFSDPNNSTLNALRNKYDIDYLLIRKDDPDFSEIRNSSLPINELGVDDEYVIYRINNES